ncbi:helix-turn-helix transcriptional regulator [Marinobacterium rhizophilum]|uniref:helix-turn-helix transcriptional regulator n=1 Tax=Marinobacterium rhizophilum TaxID=420402 RepID=UPI003B846DC4
MATAYSQPLTLEQVEQQAHCSVNHLINLFRQYFDTTPIRYLWQVRLDRAEALLRHTDIPIAAIAEQCGFASPFHFSRLFKSSREVSPRAFRSRYRALEQFSPRLKPLPVTIRRNICQAPEQSAARCRVLVTGLPGEQIDCWRICVGS